MSFFMRMIAICWVGFCLLAVGLALLAVQTQSQTQSLKMKQPIHATSVTSFGKGQSLDQSFLAHSKSSVIQTLESLELQREALQKIENLGVLARWREGLDWTEMKKGHLYTLMSHMEAMTRLLQHRRESGGFKKLQEFEFQSLLRKSDYILAAPLSLRCYVELKGEKKIKWNWQRVVKAYNNERIRFDQRAISIASLSPL